MDSTTTVPPQPKRGTRTFRRRVITENLTAYAFLLPAALLIFTFEFFPVSFAFFVSLHKWRRFPDEFEGLDTYYEALGGFAFVVFFWLAIGLIVLGLWNSRTFFKKASQDRKGLVFIVPGVALGIAFLSVLNWVFVLLPLIMDVVRRLRGQATTNATFVAEFFNSFTFPQAVEASNAMLLLLLVAVSLTAGFVRLVKGVRWEQYILRAIALTVPLIAGVLLLQLTLGEIDQAILEALEDGVYLPIWTQIVLISTGAGLLVSAIWMWQYVVRAEKNYQFWARGLAVSLLVTGGVLLIMELPPALNHADKDVLQGFNVAIMYAAFAVPLQLALGLLLAILLFQNIRFKSFFRVVFFLPYITPIVATSVVFSLLFSPDPRSPLNRFMTVFGIEEQKWLLEPKGVFEVIFGSNVPEFLAGPPLALTVIIVFGVWSFVGYSTVIFLAGLGAIDTDVYEAAKVDGANSWQQFRNITLPLLSPTTFFLVLITTIGTLQAFTQFFLMRRPGAYDAVDTINIHIFNEVRTDSPDFAYGSAMAFVLFAVILILTLIQNRIVGRKVFYG